MKRNLLILFLVLCGPSMLWSAEKAEQSLPVVLAPEPAAPAKVEVIAVEKSIELSGIVKDNKLKESIGIETLANIVTPFMQSGSAVPLTASIKLGISEKCHCAKLKIFRISSESEKKFSEVSYEALQGFSAGQKTVEVKLEVTTDEHLRMSVLPQDEKVGELSWIAVSELAKPEEVKEVKVVEKEKPKSESETEVSKNLPNVK